MVNHTNSTGSGARITTKKQILSLAKNTAIIMVIFVSLFLAGASIQLSNDSKAAQVLQDNANASAVLQQSTIANKDSSSAPTESAPADEGSSLISPNHVAESISERLPKEITPFSILLNNFKIVLLSSYLYPIGVVDTWLVAFVTGVGFSAFSSLANMQGTDVALQVLQRPFFWFEIGAYCLAAAQSVHLTRALRGSLSVKQMMILNIKQMASLFRSSTWKSLRHTDKSIPLKVRALRLILNIDLLSVDCAEAKRQLILSGIVIAIATILLTFGALAEMQDIESITAGSLLD